MNSVFEKLSIRGRKGFTLIELMIVLAVVAILVALALPSYRDQVRKSRRADAESALLSAAQVLERCFTRLNTYSTGCPDPSGLSENGYYNVTVSRTATTYTLTATAQGDQASDACGNYTLDHLGNKTPVADSKRCWGAS
ncbi:type IV pilin protein [Marinihelvus fidelis]|nr:type IV pilin protein [Marinihelvus fidelis]